MQRKEDRVPRFTMIVRQRTGTFSLCVNEHFGNLDNSRGQVKLVFRFPRILRHPGKRVIVLLRMRAASLLVACWLGAFATMASGEKVCLSNVDGAIGPATANYISRSIDKAHSEGAQCLIIQLNTPGG